MSDRTYWHVPGARSWHALLYVTGMTCEAICGRTDNRNMQRTERADRIPPTAHLCGNCARIIAARTDIEEDTTYGVTVAPI